MLAKLYRSEWLQKLICLRGTKRKRVKRIDELGKDNLAELGKTENKRMSAGDKRYFTASPNVEASFTGHV